MVGAERPMLGIGDPRRHPNLATTKKFPQAQEPAGIFFSKNVN